MSMFLSSLGSGDPIRPSFFEMLAQKEMMGALMPAVKWIFSVLSQRHSRLQWFSRYPEEIYSALLLIFENHHLRHYDASFSENFYGLKRVGVEKNKGKGTTYTPITNRQRYITLLFLVIVPYFKGKLDELYKELVPLSNFSIINYEADIPDPREPQRRTFGSSLKRFMLLAFTYGYPFFNAAYEGAFFLYQLLYLYDYTNYFSPFHHLQGLTLKRLSPQEMQAQSAQNADRRNQRLRRIQGGPLPTLWKFIVHYYDLGLDYSKLLLPISIFFFRFLDWWFHETRLQGSKNLPIPPPPEPLVKSPEGIDVPADKNICPLCKQERTNPALLASSGYVFCYPCIFNYVRDNGKCPITHQISDQEQIRKIYETM